jgi:hypothetical protein
VSAKTAPSLALGRPRVRGTDCSLSRGQANFVALVAGKAPSVHNTQPRRFACDGRHFDVFADRSRQLCRIDPAGRLLTISCGAAAQHALLALRSLGYSVHSEPMAALTSADPDRLARFGISNGGLSEPRVREFAAFQAISERHTYRGQFLPHLVHPRILTALAAEVEANGCELYRIERDGQRAEVGRLLRESNAELESDVAYFEELQEWRREDDSGCDGIPSGALGIRREAAAATAFPPRDFSLGEASVGPGRALGISDRGRPRAQPNVVAIWTHSDEPADWFAAGHAMSALLLAATSAGVSASPLDQLLEVPAVRARLRAALRIPGFVQACLRLGYAAGTPSGTPRRAVESTLQWHGRSSAGRTIRMNTRQP